MPLCTGRNGPGRTASSARGSLPGAMGLLDDAIREHLELKRRSGAPDDEIKRLESDALGGPRRVPAPAEGADAPAPPEPEAVEPVGDLVEDTPAPLPAEAALPLEDDDFEPAIEHELPEPPAAVEAPAPAPPP